MSETKEKISIGIDLGTTNSVLSYCDSSSDILVFNVPQLVAPGEIAKKRLLPSFIYFPTKAEKDSGDLRLPWDPFGERVVGEYARQRGAETSGRLVSSSKSWLSFSGVDRTKAILPVDAAEDCPKISPVVAAAIFLRHLKASWNYDLGKSLGELKDLDVTITIPASFDAVARDLSVQAARSAGLENVTLLEEPQAAFYAWLYHNRDSWKDLIRVGDVILVVDIGGGTTDFSLIQVKSEGGGIGLERIAVGRHLLLGGDNMDLALTEVILNEMAEAQRSFSLRQYNLVVQNVRAAKEALLEDPSKMEVAFSLPGPGRGLVGGTIRASLKRDVVEKVLMEGFFPECAFTDAPKDELQSGLMEFSLPYEKDFAITRHLAAFLNQNSDVHPTHLLFNGGVFKATSLQSRIIKLLNKWLEEKGKSQISLLKPVDLDLSVGIGASAFSLARQGALWRIKGGITRSYYIGIEKAGPAIPGMPPKLMALCLVPEGAEEGSEFAIEGRTFGLVVGRPVSFPFLASSTRSGDAPGDLVPELGESIEPISQLESTLEAPGIAPGTVIPVTLKVKVTEIGTLEIYMVSEEKGLSFKMEFGVRE